MKPLLSSERGLSVPFALTVIGCLLFQVSCATIFHGFKEEIEVTSEPTGAKVYVEDRQIVTTPGEISIKMEKDLMFRFEKEGYDPFEMKVKRRLSWKLLLNWLLSTQTIYYLDALGWAKGPYVLWMASPFCIDFLTGAAFVGPSKIEVKLSQLDNKEPSQ